MIYIKKIGKAVFFAAVLALPLLGFSEAFAAVNYDRPAVVQGILEVKGGHLYVNKVRLDFGEERVKPEVAPAEYYRELIGSFVVVRGFEDTEPQNFYLLHVYGVNAWGYPNPNIRMN